MVGLPAALALVPWGTLIEKAPAIAAGAADLYAKVRGRKPLPPPAATGDPDAALAALQSRIAGLETEMQGASRLIAELAEANGGLMRAVENGRRMTRLSTGTAIVALATAIGAFLT